jgi:hypothetical protein
MRRASGSERTRNAPIGKLPIHNCKVCGPVVIDNLFRQRRIIGILALFNHLRIDGVRVAV